MLNQPRTATARPTGPLGGSFRVPGDKSVSHRALMLATLAVGRSEITGLLTGEDVMATASAMRALGATIGIEADGRAHVDGAGLGALLEPADIIDFGNAGTGIRLTLGLVAGHPIAATFKGDASLSRRPMGRVLTPLRDMGAVVVARDGERLPLSIRGARTAAPIRYTLPVPSAQVKSAVLIAGLNAPGETTVVEPVPTRDHTERMLAVFGAPVRREDTAEGTAITVTGRPTLSPAAITVPADPSSAAFLIVAGLIVPGSELVVREVLLNPSRTGLIDTLREMDADLAIENRREAGGEDIGDVRVRASRLKGVTVPPDRAPAMIDEYPVLAVAAAFAEGETHMPGIGELRVKESDRLDAVAAGLDRNGVDCRTGEDWLTVSGRTKGGIGGGIVTTCLDHRIAMTFLVMGLAADRAITIDDHTPIATSFPSFLSMMRAAGAAIDAEDA